MVIDYILSNASLELVLAITSAPLQELDYRNIVMYLQDDDLLMEYQNLYDEYFTLGITERERG